MTAFMRLCLLSTTLVVALCLSAASSAQTIMVLGDSISAAYGMEPEEGWVSLLKQRLEERDPDYRVVNVSLSGETTGGGLARLPDALARHQPDIVVLELGGNDGLRGYPITRIRANLEAMIEKAQGAGAEVILAGMHIPPNYGPRYVNAFHAMFKALAERHGTGLVPFLLEDIATNQEYMQTDGIHPTASAQPLILDNLWPSLEPLLEASG